MGGMDRAGIGILAGCLFLAGFGLSESDGLSRAAYEGQTPTHQAARDRQGLPRAAEILVSNRDPNGTDELSARELAAQEAGVVWAFWTILISSFIALTTATGTYLLYRQVRITAQVVADTAKATRAMEVSNHIALKTFETGVRPWIGIDDAHLIINHESFILDDTFVFSNRGNVPACDIEIEISYSVGDTNQAEKNRSSLKYHVLPILPGASRSIGLFSDLDAQEKLDILASIRPGSPLKITGSITYQKSDKSRFETEFGGRYPVAGGPLIPDRQKNNIF